MGFRPYNEVCNGLVACLPVSSTVTGMVNSTDIGKLAVASSNHVGLALGTTADNQTYAGIIAAVPSASTAASTTPFYIRPICKGVLYEADFSTTYSTVLPASTDVGKFLGLSNTTTPDGAVLSMATLGNAVGTTSGNFFRIAKVDANMIARRVVVGTFNSSHISAGF